MDTWGVAVETYRRWMRHAVAFVRECLGVERLEPYQVDVLTVAPASPQHALIGAKGVGKSALLAWIIWWFLFTRPHSNAAVTSISGDNLRDGLWKELAKWLHRSPVLQATFTWQQTRITSREYPATWWASFRTWSKSADAQEQANTLAGLHADAMLFVIDEAGSVPQAVAVTAQAALASGPDCKLVLAGNPTSPDGPLYRAAVIDRKHWHVVKVSGDPTDPKRSSWSTANGRNSRSTPTVERISGSW
jgi:phage terminase large subunit